MREMTKTKILAVLLLAGVARLGAQTTPTPGQNQGTQGQTQGQQNPGQTQNPGADTNTEPLNPAAPDENMPAPASSESRVPTPLPLSIDANMLEFSPELEHTNFLQAGVSAGASYDTNLLSQANNEVGGAIYTVNPNIGLNMSRPRLLWTLNYSGGYQVNQRYSNFNQANHNAGIDIRYRLSPHANFRISDRFVYTGTFLNQLQGNATGLGTGVIQAPNQAVITPLATNTSDMGTVEVTYQYSAGDMIGATGSVYTSHFGNVPTGTLQLVGTTSESGSGFYTHRITSRNWSGIAYTYQRLTFSPDTQQVQTHSFFLFHTIYLQRRMQLALFAGPEYSDLTGVLVNNTVTPPSLTPVAHQGWSTAGGASFAWQGQRTSIHAGGIRKVSDGGGLLQAVTVISGNGAIRRQLTRNANIEFSGVYADSRALEAGAGAFTTLKSASASIAWEQRFGRSFSANLGYARDYQQQNSLAVPGLNVNHNRGWITIAYEFTHPLGR
jgi:hypothetical protein